MSPHQGQLVRREQDRQITTTCTELDKRAGIILYMYYSVLSPK